MNVQPQPTPGQHVLVEAKVVSYAGHTNMIEIRTPSGEVNYRTAPDRVRWRPMPDETAAEPDWRGEIVAAIGPVHQFTWHERLNEVLADRIIAALGLDGGSAFSWPTPEPLAAGVPVASLPGEPGPGAYLIGDLLAVRFPAESPDPWCVQAQNANIATWLTWDMVRDEYPDEPVRRLLPRTEATASPADAPEPLTLDPDCVDRWPGCWRFPDACRCRPAARVVPAVELPEATQADVDRALHLASVAAASRDHVMAELTTHRAAQVKLMQHLGMDGTPGEIADEAIRRLKEFRSEADNTLVGWDAEVRDIVQLEAERDEARRERDEAQRLRDSPFQALANLRRLLRDAEQVYTRMPLREKLAVNVADEAQEPAQTPGGDDGE